MLAVSPRTRPYDDLRARPAAPDDVARVIALQDAIFGDDPTRPTDAEFAERARTGDTYLQVIEIDGVLAGFCVLRDRPFRPWTSGDFFGVAPKFRGQGVGHALVKAALAAARRPIFRLFVRPSNDAARRLYAAHGLRQTARRRDSYPDGEDALVLMAWTGFPAIPLRAP